MKNFVKFVSVIALTVGSMTYAQSASTKDGEPVVINYNSSNEMNKPPKGCSGKAVVHLGPLGSVGFEYDFCSWFDKSVISNAVILSDSNNTISGGSLANNILSLNAQSKDSALDFKKDVVLVSDTGAKIFIGSGVYTTTLEKGNNMINIPVKVVTERKEPIGTIKL